MPPHARSRLRLQLRQPRLDLAHQLANLTDLRLEISISTAPTASIVSTASTASTAAAIRSTTATAASATDRRLEMIDLRVESGALQLGAAQPQRGDRLQRT